MTEKKLVKLACPHCDKKILGWGQKHAQGLLNLHQHFKHPLHKAK